MTRRNELYIYLEDTKSIDRIVLRTKEDSTIHRQIASHADAPYCRQRAQSYVVGRCPGGDREDARHAQR